MATALELGAAKFGCSSPSSGPLVIDNGGASILCMASPRSSKSRAVRVCNGSLLKSFGGSRLSSRLWTQVSNRRSSLKAANGNFRAEASGNDEEKSIAPLVPESPTGQFLVSVLRSHPHLFPAAADQQLERLAADRDAANKLEQESGSGTDLTLYKRIKEVKAEERRKAVEEIIYALIVQKFVEAGVTLVPKIPAVSDNDTRQVDISPAQERELEAVHSSEALEMVREHLAVVLGGRGTSSFLDQHTIAHISKLRVGQVYAASIMYGYFLRRVDQRFQLEKNMKALLGSGQLLDADTQTFQLTDDDRPMQSGDNLAAEAAAAIANLQASQAGREIVSSNGTPGFVPSMKSSKLRSYVMSFDPETLQTCATMRAKESLNVIEKHAEALFGKPEIRVEPDGTFKVVSDDTIRVSFSGLRRLVLEAVAFGTFLWDVETSVDSQYSLIAQ
ncbi:unnamed protein product [Calypogeia fissa]